MLSNLPEENNQNRTVQPQSGINFVLYNNEFDVVEANTGYLPVEDHINAIQILATDRMVMTEAGFIEIFVNNEAVTPVYYDNMMVVMSTGSVMEVNAYFPYGKIITGLSSENHYSPNAYKFSGKEKQEMTGWGDHGARMLDGERWFMPDPLAEKFYAWSPYSYCFNNPIKFLDIDGREVVVSKKLQSSPAYDIYSHTPMANSMFDKFNTGAMTAHKLSFDITPERSSFFGAYVISGDTRTSIRDVTAQQLTGDYRFEFDVSLATSLTGSGSGATSLGHEVFLHGENIINDIQNLIEKGVTGEKLAKELRNLSTQGEIMHNGNRIRPDTGYGGADHAKVVTGKDKRFQEYMKEAKAAAPDENTRNAIQNHYDNQKKWYENDQWIQWWNN